ncbi:MAG: CHAD domain-containing protein [Porticoccaceae bacterium]|nr:CHAD domain-containing protein [Porticoccaceae bacterium]
MIVSCQLTLQRPVAIEIKRALRSQIDKAVAAIDNSENCSQEAVHRVRKHCKNIRALLCLLAPSLGKRFKHENIWYQDTAAALSHLRDVDAMGESLDKLLAAQPGNPDKTIISEDAASWLRQQLLARKNHIIRDQDAVDNALGLAKARLQTGRQRLSKWRLKGDGLNAMSCGLEKTYGQARTRMKLAETDPSDQHLHNWRKRVKEHYCHIFLLTRIWPAVMASVGDELKRLGEVLGDDHDLAVLADFLATAEDSDHKTSILSAIATRRRSLQGIAWLMGGRLFAEKPGALRKRLELYWRVSQGQRQV